MPWTVCRPLLGFIAAVVLSAPWATLAVLHFWRWLTSRVSAYRTFNQYQLYLLSVMGCRRFLATLLALVLFWAALLFPALVQAMTMTRMLTLHA